MRSANRTDRNMSSDGAKWAVVNPIRVAPDQQFRVVSCVSGTACFAVGEYNGSAFTNQVAERWNGTRWLVTPHLAPQNGYFSLSGLACARATACIGAGGFTTGLYSNTPFAPHWNGRAWSDSRPVSPSAIASQLSGVACPSPTSCFASGGYNSGRGRPATRTRSSTSGTVQRGRSRQHRTSTAD